jgi:sorting nexin-8
VSRIRTPVSSWHLLDVYPSMWHEIRVVLHNRENALLTQAVQAFASEEQTFAENVSANWVSLANAVESMPFE